MGRTRKISRQRGGNIKRFSDRELDQELQRLERLLKAQIQGFKPRNILGKTEANIKAVEVEMAARRKNSANVAAAKAADAREAEEAEEATAQAIAASKAAAAEAAAAEAEPPPPPPNTNIQRMLNKTNANLQNVERKMQSTPTFRNKWSDWTNSPIDAKIKELNTYTNKIIAEAKRIGLTYVRNELIARDDTRSMEQKAEAMLESNGKDVIAINKLKDEKERLEKLRYKNDKMESWRLSKIGEVEDVLEDMKQRIGAVRNMGASSVTVEAAEAAKMQANTNANAGRGAANATADAAAEEALRAYQAEAPAPAPRSPNNNINPFPKFNKDYKEAQGLAEPQPEEVVQASSFFANNNGPTLPPPPAKGHAIRAVKEAILTAKSENIDQINRHAADAAAAAAAVMGNSDPSTAILADAATTAAVSIQTLRNSPDNSRRMVAVFEAWKELNRLADDSEFLDQDTKAAVRELTEMSKKFVASRQKAATNIGRVFKGFKTRKAVRNAKRNANAFLGAEGPAELPFEPAPLPVRADPPFEPAPLPVRADPPFEPAPLPVRAEPPFEPAPIPVRAEPPVLPVEAPLTAPANKGEWEEGPGRVAAALAAKAKRDNVPAVAPPPVAAPPPPPPKPSAEALRNAARNGNVQATKAMLGAPPPLQAPPPALPRPTGGPRGRYASQAVDLVALAEELNKNPKSDDPRLRALQSFLNNYARREVRGGRHHTHRKSKKNKSNKTYRRSKETYRRRH